MTDNKPEETDSRSATDENRDAITGEPGSHPIGTAAGATGAALAGATVGAAVGGPIGLAVGGVAGAVAGGMAGKGIAEAINPTVEDTYWRTNFSSRPYASKSTKYETLQPAYRYGWESHSTRMGKKWRDVEQDLMKGWEKARGNSKLAWNDAKQAVRDAWDRTGDANERMDDDGGMKNGDLRNSGDDATGKKRV